MPLVGMDYYRSHSLNVSGDAIFFVLRSAAR